MTLALILAFVVGLGSGAALTKVKLRGPVNMVAGILMPHPSDERWGNAQMCVEGTSACKHDKTCWRFMALGSVLVHERGLVVIDGVRKQGPAWRRYASATFHAQADRRALAAATGDS